MGLLILSFILGASLDSAESLKGLKELEVSLEEMIEQVRVEEEQEESTQPEEEPKESGSLESKS